MNRPFQRRGAKSNAHVGREFEQKAQDFFKKKKLRLHPNVCVRIGINGKKKHRFDLVDKHSKVLVECKSHKWTAGGNVPSAKMIGWNEAMFLFYCAGEFYRRIFFVLRDYSPKKKKTLAEYYIRTYFHLIPKGIEIWEFDEEKNTGKKIAIRNQKF